MRMVIFALPAVVLMQGPAGAQALEPHQQAAIDRLATAGADTKASAAGVARHYAMLLWVEDYCGGRSSGPVRRYLLQKGDADKDAFEAGSLDTLEILAKTDPATMCSLALQQYGPEGALIRGGWAPRAAEGR